MTETSSGRTGNRVRQPHLARYGRYSAYMTVRDLLATLQRLPKDAEVLAFEAGCEDYCEREVDEVEWQGGRCTSISASVERTAAPIAPTSSKSQDLWIGDLSA